MARKALPVIAGLVLLAVFACPMLEMFDHWDHTPKTGKDTESALVIVALCAGMAIVLVHAASAIERNGSSAGHSEARCSSPLSGIPHGVDWPPESPPLAPLRI